MGMHIGHLLWDMENFYDLVDLGILVEELSMRNYPAPLMIVGMLAHAAPRALRVGPTLSQIIVKTSN